ncbi:MAG: hotdog fold thioesterase [Flavobacteriia bacterium]|nr:hotdog fold thioesterase [Flavobacteriia bacterium]
MMEHIGIEVTQLNNNSIEAKMPVDFRTHQPLGWLHGGASVVLIESLASIGSDLLCKEGFFPIGLEINANHIRTVKSGFVTAVAKPIHLGRQTHIWNVDVFNEDSNKLICTGRITTMIVKKDFE